MPRRKGVDSKGKGITVTLSDQWIALADEIADKRREEGRVGERGRSDAMRFALACAAEKLGIITKLKP